VPISLTVSCIQKKIIHSFWSTKISSETFLAKFTKNHTTTVKRLFFCTNAKVHGMTKMLYKCANNLVR
jgi:hypothetical protein